RMRSRTLLILCFFVAFSVSAATAGETGGGAFAGQDLHLRGRALQRCQPGDAEHILVLKDEVSLSYGGRQFAGDYAVVWLEGLTTESRGTVSTEYEVRVYLQGNISDEQAEGVQTPGLSQTVIEEENAVALRLRVSGQILVTRDTEEAVDPRTSELYARAFAALEKIGAEPASPEARPSESKVQIERINLGQPAQPATQPQETEPRFRYPVNLSPVGKAFQLKGDDKEKILTVIGRFYLWQKQDEEGGLLELQADNAVIFLAEGQSPVDKNKRSVEGIAAKAIYLSGDVVMTSGQRTIRADEIYYDFQGKKGLAVNAVMRNFDPSRGIPIYIRAAELKQLSENEFEAADVTLTTSEFHLPQISVNASSLKVTDTTPAGERQGGTPRTSYDAQMKDVRVKMYDRTIFYWPFMRSNMQRPDLPIKSVRAGYDSTWGTTVETRWYLARLLGLQEPEGTDNTLALDYYGERGFGTGIESDYTGDDYFGKMLGYVIHDSGEDRLGRISSRRNLEPSRELRGRFSWQHRHFLPYDWQLTSEFAYLSDENFLEGYYRSEFNVGKEQETLVHLKHIEDNWGLSFLNKVRINDFVNQLEELPTAEFHWTGQSFLEDKLTFYSDTQVSRFRQRYASSNTAPGSEQFFSFATTRNEVDMPLKAGNAQVVPFAAATVGYEDGMGFYREIDGATAAREENVWLGETGVRVSSQPYWKVFPDVNSELLDLNQLRHVVRPHLTAAAYTQNESVFEQRNTLNAGISQRLQTKRGPSENRRSVDWMRLDMDVTWVNNSGDASAGPDRFIWNKPFIPPINTFSRTVPLQDRRGSHIFGPRRNYVGADYAWRLSDTTAVLSDMNYDLQSGVVQQFNVGFSHLRWPNLQYYVGSRYLRRLDNGYGEEGSNAFTLAATYVLDPRYTVVFSQQLDFDYGAAVRSDITLVRRYHRLFWGLTYSADESQDRQSIGLSLWPQGVGLAFGQSTDVGLGGEAGY
ncbi:MAG: LPS assembly protein LptD, partial [Planctomycetota bacterium]